MWATSKHDVYLMQNYSVMHWSALKKKSTEVINTAKPIVPTMKNCALSHPLSRVRISTMCVKDGLFAAGGFLAMAEPADFVHVLDTQSGFNNCQEIDLFGEIGGISFSPDTEALFVGVADRTYGSVLEFTRKRNISYVDAFY